MVSNRIRQLWSQYFLGIILVTHTCENVMHEICMQRIPYLMSFYLYCLLYPSILPYYTNLLLHYCPHLCCCYLGNLQGIKQNSLFNLCIVISERMSLKSNLQIRDTKIQQVWKFKYLRGVVTEDSE